MLQAALSPELPAEGLALSDEEELAEEPPDGRESVT